MFQIEILKRKWVEKFKDIKLFIEVFRDRFTYNYIQQTVTNLSLNTNEIVTMLIILPLTILDPKNFIVDNVAFNNETKMRAYEKYISDEYTDNTALIIC